MFVIVVPTTAHPAYPIGGSSPQPEMRSLTRSISLTGLPTLALPCGFTNAGLPVSMQLVGRAWEESTVLQVGYAYEQAAGWFRRRAPIGPGPIWQGSSSTPAETSTIDARWVREYARLTGLTFIDESDASPIAASIGPVKAMLAEARAYLNTDDEPPVRPAPR